MLLKESARWCQGVLIVEEQMSEREQRRVVLAKKVDNSWE